MKNGCKVRVKSDGGRIVVDGILHDIEHDRGLAIVVTVGGVIRANFVDVEEVEEPKLTEPTTGPVGNWSRI